jgi:hypothetical protein
MSNLLESASGKVSVRVFEAMISNFCPWVTVFERQTIWTENEESVCP